MSGPRYRLPAEWGGLLVLESVRHTRDMAPPGFVAVSSMERGSSGRIAFFQLDQLEAASAEPLFADERDAS